MRQHTTSGWFASSGSRGIAFVGEGGHLNQARHVSHDVLNHLSDIFPCLLDVFVDGILEGMIGIASNVIINTVVRHKMMDMYKSAVTLPWSVPQRILSRRFSSCSLDISESAVLVGLWSDEITMGEQLTAFGWEGRDKPGGGPVR